MNETSTDRILRLTSSSGPSHSNLLRLRHSDPATLRNRVYNNMAISPTMHSDSRLDSSILDLVIAKDSLSGLLRRDSILCSLLLWR